MGSVLFPLAQPRTFHRRGIKDRVVCNIRLLPLPSVVSRRGSSLTGMGTNDAKLAADNTEFEGTVISRRISPATGGRGEAGAVTGTGGPFPVDGPDF